jgi:hypothetical protein
MLGSKWHKAGGSHTWVVTTDTPTCVELTSTITGEIVTYSGPLAPSWNQFKDWFQD